LADKSISGRVVFIDSGAGGLPYLGAYGASNPKRPLLYVADKKNFPYGEKTKAGLVSLLIDLTARILKHFSPALIVLACNTASVSALAELRQRFPGTDFVGTVPAVKPALLSSVKKHVAVLGTERTLEDEYIGRLAESTANACKITRIAAAELVGFVESRIDYADRTERIAAAKKYIDLVRKSGADALVLGCTHFLFLLDEFREAAEPGIRVFDSIDGVCLRIEAILSKRPAPATATRRTGQPNLLLVTGGESGDEKWARRAARFGLTLVGTPGWDDE
jgi:glutamate racemase